MGLISTNDIYFIDSVAADAARSFFQFTVGWNSRLNSWNRFDTKNRMNSSKKKELSPEQSEELFRALKARFEKNMNRHKGLEWAKVQAKLEADAEKLWSLSEMERTGGEPFVLCA